jgi:hypothetical protein
MWFGPLVICSRRWNWRLSLVVVVSNLLLVLSALLVLLHSCFGGGQNLDHYIIAMMDELCDWYLSLWILNYLMRACLTCDWKVIPFAPREMLLLLSADIQYESVLFVHSSGKVPVSCKYVLDGCLLVIARIGHICANSCVYINVLQVSLCMLILFLHLLNHRLSDSYSLLLFHSRLWAYVLTLLPTLPRDPSTAARISYICLENCYTYDGFHPTCHTQVGQEISYAHHFWFVCLACEVWI